MARVVVAGTITAALTPAAAKNTSAAALLRVKRPIMKELDITNDLLNE